MAIVQKIDNATVYTAAFSAENAGDCLEVLADLPEESVQLVLTSPPYNVGWDYGDGDQGVTMTIGFRAIRDALPCLKGQDVGTIVTRAGLTFNGKAASTIGALLATACMRAGREAKGLGEVGIKERGKADVGDKTILDALVPLVRELRAVADAGGTLEEGLRRSLAAAEEGMKSTIPMKSKPGHQDPGATSLYLMWKSLVESVIESG